MELPWFSGIGIEFPGVPSLLLQDNCIPEAEANQVPLKALNIRENSCSEYYNVESTQTLISYMSQCINKGLSFLGQKEGLIFWLEAMMLKTLLLVAWNLCMMNIILGTLPDT